MNNAKKVLLIRLDKIGDLVSTLPVDQHPLLKNKEVRWLVGQGMTSLTQRSDPARNFQELSKKFSWKLFFLIIKAIKEFSPDLSVSFHAPWWVNLTLLIAGVPKRVSPASQWHHFLFINYRLKQNRSESTKHEADYNYELMRFALGEDLQVQKTTPILKILADDHIRLPVPLKENSYFVIHAGMAGSALNWPQKNYVALIEKLLAAGETVTLTGTALDLPYLTEIRPRFASEPKVVDLIEKLNFLTLLTVLRKSKGILAPSTGIAHLSASLEQNTLALFSPLPVQSPTRWAPRGLNTDFIKPAVDCPSHFKCLKQKCPQYPCMDKITVDQVFHKLHQLCDKK